MTRLSFDPHEKTTPCSCADKHPQDYATEPPVAADAAARTVAELERLAVEGYYAPTVGWQRPRLVLFGLHVCVWPSTIARMARAASKGPR